MNKGMSNSGAIHLLLAGSQHVAACATGKVQPMLVPLTAAEGDRPITCKRCLKLEANTRAAQVQEAGSTSEIDALLDEVTGREPGAIEAAIEAGIAQGEAAGTITADEAQSLRETAPEAARESDEAAERDAAEAAPAAPAPTQKSRVNQRALVLAYLEQNRGGKYTPHQISKAVTPAGAKALGLRDVCARLAAAGDIEIVEGEKAATYRLPLDPQYAAGEPADDAVEV